MTPLETGQLWVLRIRALFAALVLLAAAVVAEVALRDQPVPHGLVVALIAPVLLWLLAIAPKRRWQAWSYRMTEADLALGHGVWTQVRTLVPLERVQHIDISQGPVERACGVCRLVLHTAGTMHSRVVLPGLERARAEAMRSAIRARIGTGPL